MSILILLAIVCAAAGLLFASQATFGVALVGIACLLAILARIAQADRQHKEVHGNEHAPQVEPTPPRNELAPAPRWMQFAFSGVIAVAVILVILIAVVPNSFWIWLNQ